MITPSWSSRSSLRIHKFDLQFHRKNRVFDTAAKWHSVAVNDYERIAKVIRHLDGHYAEQPDLASLAESVELSPHHFHRLFCKWAGVTPKDFLQALTLEHARALLRNGHNALDTAFDTGLSGSGRLHDLCVTLEAASPGEIKSGGAGWTIEAGFATSPFGDCLIARSNRGICHLSFVEPEMESASWNELRSKWPNAHIHRSDKTANDLAANVFVGRHELNGSSPLRAFVKGTSFQVRAWRALLKVPPGHLISYGQLAATIGAPSASRAVGTAVGQNPLAYLIPCHRVIRSTGVVGDYRWGTTRKRAIVAWESGGDAPSPQRVTCK